MTTKNKKEENISQTSWIYKLTTPDIPDPKLEKPNSPPPTKNTQVVLPAFQSQIKPQPTFFTTALESIQSFFSKPKKPLKKIVIVGVHGWFPMKVVRTVMGEPTGTSTKFCEQMKAATLRYFQEHQMTIDKITTVPLEWEGKVLDRVDRLYGFIERDWKNQLREADLILWVTHSQGTPVSTLLIQKLFENNVLRDQKMTLFAMAGISHGPFPFLKGNLFVKYFEADAARELFDFMDSESEISKVYRGSMGFVLKKMKVVLMGSLEDQVVPLYSSIMAGASHPNLLRAVYVDRHIEHDFLIQLITFSLRLLNLGLSDHGFLIHISEVLAGNIYAWEGGHSTIYEEPDVFLLPLQNLFEAAAEGSGSLKVSGKTEKAIAQVEARLDPFQAKHKLNPFHLPWAMRGIWDDPRILNHPVLSSELTRLLKLYDTWYPSTSKLKEIKFRLEPLKSKL